MQLAAFIAQNRCIYIIRKCAPCRMTRKRMNPSLTYSRASLPSDTAAGSGVVFGLTRDLRTGIDTR